jgi:mono/diheme cytochrome c family protein
MRIVIAATAVAILFGAGSALAQDAKKIERGKEVYQEQKCSVCHSIEGKGNKKFPLDGVGSKLSAEDIRLWHVDPRAAEKKFNSTAKPPMPNYKKLSDEDLDAIVAYMLSLKK